MPSSWREVARYYISRLESTNAHSVRVYEYRGRRFHLDRCLDTCPPSFSLEEEVPGKALGRDVPVNEERYWGDGLSWPKAERLAFEAVRKEVGP